MTAGHCYDCGKHFKELGSHWSRGKCDHKQFTEHQMDILTGVMMGDGTLGVDSKNPRVMVTSIQKDYLEYFSDQFGVLSNDPRLNRTAEKSKEMTKQSLERVGDGEYHDVYTVTTMRHPQLLTFYSWYDGEKEWPDDIELTPTVLKHWYVGDGSFHNYNSNGYISIAISNELGNEEKINSYFKKADLPSPSNYTTWERNDGSVKFDMKFTVSQTKELFEYMGDPLPGFYYKWPEEQRT